ncbi:CoA-substrate-specific enzyme activase [Elusimicrobium minutum Pei191]|uniref:CoA-substrate-specific enzyme activase n=1 Tax=Elusimicrobium minutum (strain Pei191) TaxID=445932 RepID=B2KBH0_ELUMP|nr:2-hydroxyacyl-CoA dehydratase [Elusimicrobium minutum]ACC97992.1 CoA-substrate-specific enzyme activase [Elusimicrobium minutum Pei191]
MADILKVGLDIGSTTAKIVVISTDNEILYSDYKRHHLELGKTILALVRDVMLKYPEQKVKIAITGSGAIKLSQEAGIQFVQEVVACTLAIKTYIPQTEVAIEIGGEDAKITFFDSSVEQRMNETCAGGTGAFIDQMAAVLRVEPMGLNELAKNYKTIYPIAARCGVFAKTDVMPLLNDGAPREDIAASILQSVVNQTIGGLACGRTIRGNVAFLGGPLYFFSELRKRFIETLKLPDENIVFPKNPHFFVAMGAALSAAETEIDLKELYGRIEKYTKQHSAEETSFLPPLFNSDEEIAQFKKRHSEAVPKYAEMKDAQGPLFLGLDAGSTTTKAVVIDENSNILYTHYGSNEGSPLDSAVKVIKDIYDKLPKNAFIQNGCVTGYGEALLKAALGFDGGEVETIAHYKAARYFVPQVSFILDIGGQDMKCIYVDNGVIDKIVLNEACSSGCGSFIENFALSLGTTVQEFAEAALTSKKPVDLGSRCTVFMNSKVKQALKEGSGSSDISAGLSYSVIRNALYKVIKVKSPEDLGQNIVVQGGTFFNNAVLRATELLVSGKVTRPTISGVMGAFGAALIALEERVLRKSTLLSKEELNNFTCTNKNARCKGCSNNCLLTISKFGSGKTFISGNRCEKGLGLESAGKESAVNMYEYKYKRLFDHYKPLDSANASRGEIGMPRVLNMYENYPFWFTLFTELGFRVVLSDKSSVKLFNSGLDTIPSQTICYPAKMVHGHIINLTEKGVKTIFYPCLPFEQKEFSDANNHYNCPVVGSYPEVVRLNMDVLEKEKIKFLQPFLPIDSFTRLEKRLLTELKDFNIEKKELRRALKRARGAQNLFKKDIRKQGAKIIEDIKKGGSAGIILAGRPYHLDPAINHGIPEFIAACGVAVLTEDSVAHLGGRLPFVLNVIDQWTYHSRLYRAAHLATSIKGLEVVQLNSFGCGLDAITTEQVEDILRAAGKVYTVLKIDEGSNLGTIKIRVRSLLASVKERPGVEFDSAEIWHHKHPVFTKEMRKDYTILCPQMSPVHFSLLASAVNRHGYNLEVLPNLSKEDVEEGLKYVNNDACYPAIVVVGQLINALKSGKYNTDKTALIISQTGGGCRATNYVSFLRSAAAKAGFKNVPVIAFAFGGDKHPGFNITVPMFKDILAAFLLGDLVMRMANRLRPYEIEPGSVNKLVEETLSYISKEVIGKSPFKINREAAKIVKTFDAFPIKEERRPRVGIVGEILVKFHPDANNRLVDVIESEGGEAIVPDLMDFVNYCLMDDTYRHKYLSGKLINRVVSNLIAAYIEFCRKPLRKMLEKSLRFNSYKPTRYLAKKVEDIVSVCNQTGEGWLLTAEMLELMEEGANNIVCVQPFGCLPNHITGKGVTKELKRRYKDLNMVAIDYDPGASEVNQLNRIKLMMSVAHSKK